MYALINGTRLLDGVRLLDDFFIQQIMASLIDEDAAAYPHESVVRGHHIYKRVRSPTVGEVLQHTREERNDHDCLLCAEFVGSPSA